MALLKVENITKTYGSNDNKVTALDAVSFSVDKGEFVAIVGASGSGKSTLMHIIGGIDKPDSGNIILDNESLFSLSKDKLAMLRRRKIGLIYQFYNLVPILTVEENIVLPVRLDGKKIDSAFLTELLELLHLSDRRRHLPNQLSGGQQQRTAICRAIFQKPSLILADEPTGNLDRLNGEDVISYLEKLNSDFGHTILLITHDTKISQRAKRIITLDDGRIISDIQQ